MPTTHTTSDTAERTVDEQFLDLVCSDPGLLAGEFEAIIAAQWPDPPVCPPGHSATGWHLTSRSARRLMSRVRKALAGPRRLSTGGSARQRSPPV